MEEENRTTSAGGMNRIGAGFCMAFQMYSRIPMPRVDWDAANMRYMMAFFPMVGAAIGAAVYGAARLCAWLGLPQLLTAVFLILLPVLISGGIHLDGFMDVCDAAGSARDRERKLEIMKDSHVGSFAVVGLAVLFLLLLGAWYQLPVRAAEVLALGFVLSRACSGYLVIREKNARTNGLNVMFSGAADKRRTKGALYLYMIACAVLMLIISIPVGITALAAAAVCVILIPRMARRQFGGWTGDVAGFFLQVCEAVMAVAVSVAAAL